ncbi:hypothetical protein H4R18_002329 [Coemansia javaensis]|uniref:COP9 signalosome complex subunit 4 n=1 Tax=Coemansia javaensis TaxID=2761396 RepID=A0A9W8HB48_9FUNG|nr:hypothetical protein H4R18_002329 [Coemansia javaensis]
MSLAAQLSELFRGDALDTAEGSERAAAKFVQDTLAEHAQGGAEAQQQALADVVDACVGEHVAQPAAAAVLGALTRALGAGPLDAAVRQAALRRVVDRTQQRASAFETVVIDARRALAALVAGDGRPEEAAALLQGIRFDQSQRTHSAREMLAVHMEAIELFLAAGRPEQAAQVQIRAAPLLGQVADPGETARYRYFQARTNELSLKYIEAATMYHAIAQSGAGGEARQREALERAIQCAVVASAGPQKMRVMADLHREELAAALPCYGLLGRMVQRRLVGPAELQQLGGLLEAGRDSPDAAAAAAAAAAKAQLLDHAVREHNVFVLSSLYANMRFENLGRMLGVGADEAELLCARMIEEGRMKGRIDQVDGVITFEGAREVKEVSAAISLKSQAAAAHHQQPPMHFREVVAARWDDRIVRLCTAVEEAVDLLIDRHPVYTNVLFKQVG